jgi:hypothetical protein
MEEQWRMVIVPSMTETRVWGRDARREVTLRAKLPARPHHPQALPLLLEALGSFLPVRAAIVVPDQRATYATSLYPGWWGDFGGVRYTLEVVRFHLIRCLRVSSRSPGTSSGTGIA